jgi:hypothetical protein
MDQRPANLLFGAELEVDELEPSFLSSKLIPHARGAWSVTAQKTVPRANHLRHPWRAEDADGTGDRSA